MKRERIDLTQVKASGLHGLKIGNEISQMVFTDASAAISFAQRFVPARGVQRVSIIPVNIVEMEYRR